MTPLHLEILIHYYSSRSPFHRPAPVVHDYTLGLCRMGLLYQDDSGVDRAFGATDMGKAYLEHILKTPMPKQAWVWE